MPRMRRVASRHSGHGTDTTDSSSGSGVNGTETGSSGSGVNGTETGSSGSGGDAGGRDHGWRQQRLAYRLVDIVSRKMTTSQIVSQVPLAAEIMRPLDGPVGATVLGPGTSARCLGDILAVLNARLRPVIEAACPPALLCIVPPVGWWWRWRWCVEGRGGCDLPEMGCRAGAAAGAPGLDCPVFTVGSDGHGAQGGPAVRVSNRWCSYLRHRGVTLQQALGIGAVPPPARRRSPANYADAVKTHQTHHQRPASDETVGGGGPPAPRRKMPEEDAAPPPPSAAAESRANRRRAAAARGRDETAEQPTATPPTPSSSLPIPYSPLLPMLDTPMTGSAAVAWHDDGFLSNAAAASIADDDQTMTWFDRFGAGCDAASLPPPVPFAAWQWSPHRPTTTTVTAGNDDGGAALGPGARWEPGNMSAGRRPPRPCRLVFTDRAMAGLREMG